VNTPNLREGLLGAEEQDPDLKKIYRERLRVVTERRLTGPARVAHGIGMLFAVVLIARFLQLFLQSSGHGRPEELAGLGLGLAFSVGWALAELAVLRAGVERLFSHTALRTMLIVGFTSLHAGLMLWAGLESADPARGVRLILFGLVFWCVIGLPFFISYLVKNSEVRMRMALLRMELQLPERGTTHVVRS
jgi:hypothetical protein